MCPHNYEVCGDAIGEGKVLRGLSVRKTVIYAGFVFCVGILFNIFKPTLFYKALVKTEYAVETGYSKVLKYRFEDNGCYMIGLVSKNDQFLNHVVEGEYLVEFFDSKGMLIGEEKLENNRFTHIKDRTFKELGMFSFGVPYEGKYRNLRIRFTTVIPDSKLKLVEDNIYLYVNRTGFSCNGEYEKRLNHKKYGIVTYSESNSKFRPLFIALKNKQSNSVKEIFDKSKIPFNVKMTGDREPIHYAAYFNDVKTLKYLIANRVDLNPVDITGYTPIQYAIANDAPEAAELLLSSGVKIQSVEKVPSILSGYRLQYENVLTLFYSQEICSLKLIETLLENGADVNQYFTQISGRRMTVLEYLLSDKCRKGPGKKETIQSKKQFAELKELLMKYKAKRSPDKFKSEYIGKKGI